MKTPPTWEQRFDKQFGEINQHYEEFFYTEHIKHFIRTLLAAHEATLRQEIGERVSEIFKSHRQRAEALTEYTTNFSTKGAMGFCDEVGQEVLAIINPTP